VRRGRNREPCFHSTEDYALYLSLMVRAARDTATAVHAYVLMTNHVHLMITAHDPHSPSRFMHGVGLAYGRETNRKYGRTGTLWEERFFAVSIDSDRQALACLRYIELNPVRARMVDTPDSYRWSSYRENVNHASTSWLTPHPSLLALASTREDAVRRYRQLFAQPIEEEMLASLRNPRVPPPGTWFEPRSGGQAALNWSAASRA
jgi:putative transposase